MDEFSFNIFDQILAADGDAVPALAVTPIHHVQRGDSTDSIIPAVVGSSPVVEVAQLTQMSVASSPIGLVPIGDVVGALEPKFKFSYAKDLEAKILSDAACAEPMPPGKCAQAKALSTEKFKGRLPKKTMVAVADPTATPKKKVGAKKEPTKKVVLAMKVAATTPRNKKGLGKAKEKDKPDTPMAKAKQTKNKKVFGNTKRKARRPPRLPRNAIVAAPPVPIGCSECRFNVRWGCEKRITLTGLTLVKVDGEDNTFERVKDLV